LEAKLAPLLKNNKVPSALAAGFFRMARRFLLGRSPANSLEASVFEILGKLSPQLRRVLVCSLQALDALPPRDRDRLLVAELTSDSDQPVEAPRLGELVSHELLQRFSEAVFNETDCAQEERPGLVRVVSDDPETSFIPVKICRLNGLRTNASPPELSLGDYQPQELQQQCTPEVIDGEVILDCQFQTEPCPGNAVEGTCLRVPDVRAGDGVILQGVNFFNIDAKVKLVAQPPATGTREVDAHVCGDEETPLTETVEGKEVTIGDCRVHDIVTFRVPGDLPPAIYGIKVVVPNNTGLPGFEQPEFESGGFQFIRVLPPETGTFQIASEILNCIKETPAPIFPEAGSDDVALRIIRVPILENLTPGEMNDSGNIRFSDVDSGEQRSLNRVLFQGGGVNTSGVSLVFIGFEVDNEDVFEKQIEDFEDAFVEILKSEWNAIASAVGALGGAVALALGLSSAWAAAISTAVALAINVFVALWAPADLIIEDAAAFTMLDLALLTGINFPPPPEVEFTSPGDIKVKVVPVSKGVQYRERREYRSNAEYHITLRYNRLS
jgi:hypothetical protein